MTDRQQALGILLDKIADELNITDTMMERAVSSYEVVGKWIGEGIDYEVCIKPQGSMNLGTVVRPIDDSDDYDMDLVCLLKDGYRLDSDEIKNIVGDRLKENGTYREKLEQEGKRCWTMQYNEFHMDILPCVPKEKVYLPLVSTAIRLTHKLDNGEYTPKYSDPEAYHDWFVERMNLNHNLLEKKSAYDKNKTEIDKVPTYKRRTALQKAIQLLKRHRDIMFKDNNDNAPISIILTTLAALSYDGDNNVYTTLSKIIQSMPMHIKEYDGKYFIPNPVMMEENFADKWNEIPEKATAFYTWLSSAQKDILEEPLKFAGIDDVANNLASCLGESPVKRALNKYGEEMKSSRDKGELYVNGLTGGLGAKKIASSTLVKGHTFFGKQKFY